jgi:hypothetical protein
VVPAPECLCDTQFEDCSEPILNLIRNEQVGIDVAFWYMQDSRYVTELVARFKNDHLPIRIIVENGHVELAGVVLNDMDRQLAFMRANVVPGIFSVKNNLSVASELKE